MGKSYRKGEKMNIKKAIYVNYSYLRGYRSFDLYQNFLRQLQSGISPETTNNYLTKLLAHCQQSVPYYRDWMQKVGKEQLWQQNPTAYLQKLPVLTKEIIRQNSEQLKSQDLSQRQWQYNTSGGSTGEPIKLIQDREFKEYTSAIKLLYSHFAGRELGEPEIRLWGSERDIFQNTLGWKAKLFNFLSNTQHMNAFRMTPERMQSFLRSLNRQPPKLIIAYAQAIYELAKFAESENIQVISPGAIITSAGTLYPWMRQQIQTVFQCPVYNRYGSREVSDIACERPDFEGLWVAPWCNYIEIVDDNDNLVPEGTEGNILVTSLTNYAMPLIRYKIGDIGSLSHDHPSEQVFKHISGRNVDMFVAQDGTLVDGEYFTHLFYFKDWVKQFQIIQETSSKIAIKIIKSNSDYQPQELEEIIDKCQLVMGTECQIEFEFVGDIPTTASGKYRYTISKVA